LFRVDQVIDDPHASAFSAIACSPAYFAQTACSGNYLTGFRINHQMKLKRSIILVVKQFEDPASEYWRLDEYYDLLYAIGVSTERFRPCWKLEIQ
jgi:hypothetical protein